MIAGVPLLGFGIFAALIAGIAVWIFVRSSRADEMRRAALKTKKMYQQPWGDDRKDGRGNR